MDAVEEFVVINEVGIKHNSSPLSAISHRMNAEAECQTVCFPSPFSL
jgi:hypothetical protein